MRTMYLSYISRSRETFHFEVLFLFCFGLSIYFFNDVSININTNSLILELTLSLTSYILTLRMLVAGEVRRERVVGVERYSAL